MSNNSFTLFYYKFYKNILDAESPNLSSSEKLAKAARLWSKIPDELKNSFICFFEKEMILKSNIVIENTTNLSNNDISNFPFTFDKHCYQIRVKDDTDMIDKMFREYIREDAYEH
ncbi:unnamed protein product [Rhizophagus irregularis]|uniref:HMG box domain-containing protein n=1 Tax=Rhizophagus irregularis TaxID=588596 RepID=A0A2I1G8S5_9GLOM|nr:hypothetical protein RhiirA4_456951 [Rhizophagus irregularis]CAB4424333.1 unnamed protein product [Rhizophagus irregularis]